MDELEEIKKIVDEVYEDFMKKCTEAIDHYLAWGKFPEEDKTHG